MTEHMQFSISERLLLGVTTIVLRCNCGDLKTVEILGTDHGGWHWPPVRTEAMNAMRQGTTA